MKILHFSDTHLGFNDLDIINNENINQREADFYDAFSEIVEQIKISLAKFKRKLNSKVAPRISDIASTMHTQITKGKYQHIEVSNDFDFYIYDEGKNIQSKDFQVVKST